jgi:hypothetical protein
VKTLTVTLEDDVADRLWVMAKMVGIPLEDLLVQIIMKFLEDEPRER